MKGRPTRAWRLLQNRLFLAACLAGTSLAVVALLLLIGSVASQGAGGLGRWSFFTNFASSRPGQAGIRAPLAGSVWVCATCMAISLPLGVATALYLEEFAARSRWSRLVELNVRNLAGVPSIVYGIIGLTAFGRMFGLFGSQVEPTELHLPWGLTTLRLPLGTSVLAGGLTLMLVILPIIIIASQEALRAVPRGLRESSLALGATKWQTTWGVVLPTAAPTILTGSILALSRAIGEAAPLIVLGVPLFINSTPGGLSDAFTVLPQQIYNWASRPQAAFHELAASGIIVLLAVLLSFNALAIFLRHRLQRGLAS